MKRGKKVATPRQIFLSGFLREFRKNRHQAKTHAVNLNWPDRKERRKCHRCNKFQFWRSLYIDSKILQNFKCKKGSENSKRQLQLFALKLLVSDIYPIEKENKWNKNYRTYGTHVDDIARRNGSRSQSRCLFMQWIWCGGILST